MTMEGRDIRRLRPRPGTVIALVALFIAVAGGTAVALRGHNSVRSDDIVNGQVKSQDLAAVKQIAVKANPVGDADPCVTNETGVFCGAGSLSGLRGWSNIAGRFAKVTYSRDAFGTVHLAGTMVRSAASPTMSTAAFILPKGYRPSAAHQFAVAMGQTTACAGGECDDNLAVIDVDPNGQVLAVPNNDNVSATVFGNGISVDGVAFAGK